MKENNTDESDSFELQEEDPLQIDDKQSQNQTLNTLLTDYEVASKDAQYRDKLINQSYYLIMIVGGLIINGGLSAGSLFSDSPLLLLISILGISLFGTFSFFLLIVYVTSFNNSRNNAWARREQIEKYLRDQYPGAIATNKTITNSLGKNKDGFYIVDGFFARRSASDLTCAFVKILFATCLLSSVICIYIIYIVYFSPFS